MYEYKCHIVKVVDGDTVDVDIDLGFGVWLRKQRIRLVGIDTPESRTSDKVEKIYGLNKRVSYKVGHLWWSDNKDHKDVRGSSINILVNYGVLILI